MDKKESIDEKFEKKLSRRDIIRLGVSAGAAAIAVGLSGCIGEEEKPPSEKTSEVKSKTGETTAENKLVYTKTPGTPITKPDGAAASYKTGIERTTYIPTTCLQCNIEDGVLGFVEDGRVVKFEGNPKHPGTRGKMCGKGQAGANTVYHPDRILYPLRRVGARGAGKWRRISWDDAFKEIGEKVREILNDPNRSNNEIVFHHGRSRISNLEKRFLYAMGSRTQLNHTATCESSKKVGMETTWGPDIETPDFKNTNYILNFGSNIYESAYFHNPYIQRIVEGRVENNAKLVTFDVRLSNTAGRSDEWFAPFPGTDGAIALAMANVIMQNNLHDADFIKNWTNVSVDELKNYLKQFTPEWAAKISGISASDIKRIALEFGKANRATTYTYRGPCMHFNGSYNERCTMLLPIITGNVEKKGGYCLPRGHGTGKDPDPIPSKPKEKNELYQPHEYPLASHHVCGHIAHMIKEGREKVGVYFMYTCNPVFTFPDGETWIHVLKDESLVPFHVSIDVALNETNDFADIILPDTTYLERLDPENMPSAMIPWVGLRQPVSTVPMGQAKSFQDDMIIGLAEGIDPDGSLGVKKYFEYGSRENFVKHNFDTEPDIKKAGGLTYMKKHGVWAPADPEAEPEYELYKKELKKTAAGFECPVHPGETLVELEDAYGGVLLECPQMKKAAGVLVGGKGYAGFPIGPQILIKSHDLEKFGFEGMPHYEPIPQHQIMKSDELVLTTFKWNLHVQSRTSNCKWLTEVINENPAWINKKTASERGIKDGDLIRVTSPIGYMVTKAKVTEGIHPKVVAISNTLGHWKWGRYATVGRRSYGSGEFKVDDLGQHPSYDDPDLKRIWWNNSGVNPNPIIPISTDPIGGSQAWYDTVITVEKAKAGDNYGDVNVDLNKAHKEYKETLEYTTNVAGETSGGH